MKRKATPVRAPPSKLEHSNADALASLFRGDDSLLKGLVRDSNYKNEAQMQRHMTQHLRKLAKRTGYQVRSEVVLADGNRIDVLVINPDDDALVIELKYVHPQYVTSRTCTYVYTLCQYCERGFLSRREPSERWYDHMREKHHVTETFANHLLNKPYKNDRDKGRLRVHFKTTPYEVLNTAYMQGCQYRIKMEEAEEAEEADDDEDSDNEGEEPMPRTAVMAVVGVGSTLLTKFNRLR